MLQPDPSKMRNRQVTASAPPTSTNNIPSTHLVAEDFDEVIDDKAYSIIYEKAILCPCKSGIGRDALPSCLNCGGQGWVFFNPIKAKFLIQGMSKNKSLADVAEWSGSFQITPRANDDIVLAYMDRITLRDTYAQHSEYVEAKPVVIDNQTLYIAFLTYKPSAITDAFMFVSDSAPLTPIPVSDIIIDPVSRYVSFPSMGSYSIRYQHEVQLVITNISRDLRYSPKETPDGRIQQRFPQSAMGRRLHQQFDPIPAIGDGLFDNSTK